MRSKIRWLPILLYSLAALLISAWLLKLSYFIGYDGVYYARVGENIFAGKGVAANAGEAYTRKPSFYPFVLGLANLVFHNSEFSGHFVSILAFALAVIPLFLIAHTLYGEKVAHWASFLYVTNGYLHLHANLVMTESLFTLLVLLLLLLVLDCLRREKWNMSQGILLGGVSGLAFLTRLEGILFLGVSLVAILFLSSAPLKLRMRTLGASLALFLVFFLPYLHFLHQHTNQWQLGNALTEILIRRQMDVAHPGKYLEMKKIYQGLSEDKTRIKLNELVEHFNLGGILRKDHYALFGSIFPTFVWALLGLNKYLFGGLGFFLIGASWFAVPWDRRRLKSELVLFLFLSTFVIQLFGEFIPKRYFFYFPLFLLWMAKGLEVFQNWLKQSFRVSKKASVRIVWGVLLFCALASAGYVARTVRESPMPLEYKELGRWMKRNIPEIENEKVVSSHPSVNFYSGAQLLNPPHLPYVEKFEDFLTYAHHQKAKYFVVSENESTSALVEPYRFLLEETRSLPRGIRFVHKVGSGTRKLMLFEIRP